MMGPGTIVVDRIECVDRSCYDEAQQEHDQFGIDYLKSITE